MKINKKISLINAASLIILMTVIYLLSYIFIVNDVKSKESNDVNTEIKRVQYLLNDNINSMAAISGDWAPWDDTLTFIKDKNQKYIENNLSDTTFINLHINFMIFLDDNYNVVYSNFFDLDKKESIEFPKELLDYILNNKRYLMIETVKAQVSGITNVNDTPMFISSRPITSSDFTAPYSGTFICGKYIDNEVIEKIEKISGAKISFEKIKNYKKIDENALLINNNNYYSFSNDNSFIKVLDKEKIQGSFIQNCIKDKPLFLVKLSFNRTSFLQAIRSTNIFVVLFVIASILIYSITTLLIRKNISTPLVKMINEVCSIKLENNSYNKLKVNSKDEIGDLAKEINKMLIKIENSNNSLYKRENQLKLLMEASEAGFWEWDIKKDIVKFDWKLSSILSLEKNTYNDMKGILKENIPSEDLEYILEFLEKSLKGTKGVNVIEHRFSKTNETYKWFLNQCAVVEFDENNHPLKIMGIMTDITDKKNFEEELSYLNYYDKLTGVFNRGYYELALRDINKNNSIPFSIILCDINGLRLINDNFGYHKGDLVLIRVANILKKICDVDATIARYGGDEFIIILPNVDDNKADEICSSIEEHILINPIDSIYISLSLGHSTKDNPSQSIDNIIKKAEEKMYRNKLLDNNSSRNSIISSLTKTLQEKSHETEEHTERIFDICVKVGKILNLSNDEFNELSLLAKLHDIGKIGIDEQILNKPGKLTESEWEIMKTHTEIGYRIASSTPDLMHVAYGILTHHERYDGSGYPKGLKGEEIPLLSRIISIIDSFDVMTNERPYKKAMSIEDSIDELKRCAGSQFDPNLVKVFIKALKSSDLDNC